MMPALLAGIIWLYLSFFFRLDRLYGDSAFYLFNVINDLKFSIAHRRPAGYLVEFIPLFLAKRGSDMKTIIEWFSINESIVLVSVALVAYWIIRDVKIFIAVLIPFFLGDRYNYFNPVSELLLASPILILWIGMLDKFGSKNFVNILFVPFIVFFVYSHPLFNLLFPISYGILVLQRRLHIKWIILHMSFFAITAFYHFAHINNYDKQQIDVESSRGVFETLQYYFSLSELGRYLVYCIPLFVLISFSIYTFYKTDKKLLALYCSLISIGYFLIVFYKFQSLFPETLEPFERYLFPLSVFAGLLFYYAGESKRINWSIAITLIIVFQTLQIVSYGKNVQTRNKQLINVIEYSQQNNLCKVVVDYFNFNPYRLGHDWIMTSESMLLSKVVGNKRTVQVSVLQSFDKDLFNRFENNQYVYFPWYSYNQNELNQDYFHFYEQGLYLLNTKANLDSIKLDSVSKKIEVSVPDASFKANRSTKLFVNLINQSTTTIPSLFNDSNDIVIGYSWLDSRNKVIERGSVKLLADLRPGNLKQLVSISCPNKKGEYKLSFAFLYGERRSILKSYPETFDLK